MTGTQPRQWRGSTLTAGAAARRRGDLGVIIIKGLQGPFNPPVYATQPRSALDFLRFGGVSPVVYALRWLIGSRWRERRRRRTPRNRRERPTRRRTRGTRSSSCLRHIAATRRSSSTRPSFVGVSTSSFQWSSLPGDRWIKCLMIWPVSPPMTPRVFRRSLPKRVVQEKCLSGTGEMSCLIVFSASSGNVDIHTT